MGIFEDFLDQRRPVQPGADWLHADQPPELRLLRFDAWAGKQLATHIDWSWAAPNQDKRMLQCRAYLERLVLEMWRRGWMLDGKQLAAHIEGVLQRIGKYQKAGNVREFWPYFRETVDRYVGLNAEEIRAEAIHAGSHIQSALSALTRKGPTVPELLATRAGEVADAKEVTLRDKQARARRLQAAKKAVADQPQLF